MGISDLIAAFITEELEAADGVLELQRSDLAQRFISIGTPLLRANVANPWRVQWKEISFEIPHSFIIFFSGLQIFQ